MFLFFTWCALWTIFSVLRGGDGFGALAVSAISFPVAAVLATFAGFVAAYV